MANDLDALLARDAVRECVARFCRAMDRFDRELFASAFWHDATIAAGPYVGDPAGCWEWSVPMHQDMQELTHHVPLHTNVEVDGDDAHAETYYQFVARNRDGSLLLAGGRYLDRCELRGTEWRIAERVTLVEWSCLPPAIPPPFGDVPGIADNGVSARDRTDPSYGRPLKNRRDLTA